MLDLLHKAVWPWVAVVPRAFWDTNYSKDILAFQQRVPCTKIPTKTYSLHQLNRCEKRPHLRPTLNRKESLRVTRLNPSQLTQFRIWSCFLYNGKHAQLFAGEERKQSKKPLPQFHQPTASSVCRWRYFRDAMCAGKSASVPRPTKPHYVYGLHTLRPVAQKTCIDVIRCCIQIRSSDG